MLARYVKSEKNEKTKIGGKTLSNKVASIPLIKEKQEKIRKDDG